MFRYHIVIALLAASGIGGCGVIGTGSSSPASFSDEPASGASLRMEAAAPAPRAGYEVVDLRVDVPADLRISEANVYYPIADIVWRGDPHGDRRAQIATIFHDAFASTAPVVRGGPQAVATVQVTRFHALTEKARYTIGGVHSVQFFLTLHDAASGVILDGPRRIKADMRASGGSKAIAEDAAGYTQRVAVTRHLAGVLADAFALNAPVAPTASLSTSSLARTE